MVPLSLPQLGPHSRGHLEGHLYFLRPRSLHAPWWLDLEDKSIMSSSQKERAPLRVYLHVIESHEKTDEGPQLVGLPAPR